MEILVIFCFIVTVVCVVCLAVMSFTDYIKTDDIKIFKAGMICGICIYSFIIFFWCGILLDKPTALDVYRGKTTLEITYKDSVATDSVVVFKKN